MKKLIIAPHADDEVLGCGGIIEKGDFVYFCGIDETHIIQNRPDPKHRIPLKEREAEIKKVMDFLGCDYKINDKSKVNNYDLHDFIGEIEAIINEVKPDSILIPHPGFNQDHQQIFKACQVALRPQDQNFFVKKVLIYEAIHDFLWPCGYFEPTCFFPIDIDRKINSYLLHASQIRGHRSTDMIKKLASLRGVQANTEWAEAFQVMRWVE